MKQSLQRAVELLLTCADPQVNVDRPSRRTSVGRSSILYRVATIAALLGPAVATAAPGVARNGYPDYEKRIRSTEMVGALKDDLFGDKVSLFNGGTEFAATDVDIPGNNALPVKLGRRFKVDVKASYGVTSVGSGPDSVPLGGFGSWDIDVPYITTTVDASWGWKVGVATSVSLNRCSGHAVPRVTEPLEVNDVWNGYYLNIPGEGEQELMLLGASHPKPSDGQTYRWGTRALHRGRCLAGNVNYPGEGFAVVDAQGTTYTFNYAITRDGGVIEKGGMHFSRQKVYLMATRVQDRHGNYVDYQYAGDRLNRIASSDGRAIDVYWTGNAISRVVAHGREWKYFYGPVMTVQLPDNSQWTYEPLGSLTTHAAPSLSDGSGSCDKSLPASATPFSMLITHPSGAQGRFDFAYTWFARSGVHENSCSVDSVTYDDEWGTVVHRSMKTPNYFYTYALTSKKISGPGLQEQQWTYNYDDQADSTLASYAGSYCSACDQDRSTTVREPDGVTQQHVFGAVLNFNEGRLLGTYTRDAGGALVKSVVNEYVSEQEVQAGVPFPNWVGELTGSDSMSALLNRPLKRTTISQDGATFNSVVPSSNNFDVFARPISTDKWSSLGYSKTDVTEYYDNTAKWVVGQVKREYNAGTGVVMSQTDYDPATALPIRQYEFGRLIQTLGYYGDGTLATVTDGRNKTTTLSNWKRGIPRNIQHPDTTTESAVVDDIGWITAVTDENGYATGYGYDAMGRLASVVYPDGEGWNTKYSDFKAIQAGEWMPPGVSAGQWRNISWQGNYRKVTYFDAMWRPVLVHEYDEANNPGTLRSTSTTYHTSGRVAFQSYPSSDLIPAASGNWTFYDPLGRTKLIKQDSELGNQLEAKTEYLSGFRVRTINPRGLSTTVSYQAYDQPNYDAPTRVEKPEGQLIEIWRDTFAKPTRIRQSGTSAGVWADVSRYFVYDGYQQLCKRIEPETGATVMEYDGAGNLGWSVSGLQGFGDTGNCNRTEAWNTGLRVHRSYDARNRLTALRFPDGRGDQDWSYTPDGLPSQVTTYNDPGNAAPVSNSYVYNKRRLMVQEISGQTSWYNWGIGYGYDANGNLSGQVYPTNLVIDYAPNALGQPTKAGAYATGVTYYPNGAIKQFTYGNGVVHTMTQNARQLPSRSSDLGGPNTPLDYRYYYDANANIASIADDALGSHYSRWMEYDGLDRLTSAGSCSFGGDCYHRFTYDAIDNLKSWKLPGVKDYANYVYDASNRLTNIQNSAGASVVGLGYDVQGNLQNRNGQAYSFDFGNRLREVTSKEAYRYDAHGRRVLNWRPNGTLTLSLYSQAGQVMYQENSSKTLAIENVYLGGSLLASRERNWVSGVIATKYQHTDALGSPVAVTNESGQVIERTQYEPFGATINKTIDGIGYTGHVMDAATGLTYMQQRYYDQQIGRFLSVDPVTADGNSGDNFNRYWYANNNPYRFKDPDGRYIESVIDVALIVADVADIASNGLNWANGGSLAANVVGLALPGATGLGAGVRAVSTGVDAARGADKVAGAAKAAGLETRGARIEGGRKIADTLPKGITDVKNAKGETFKSVHTTPSKPHAGMAQHTHPNYRNNLPDGTVRSGVSRHADPVSRKDVIDATRPNAQRTGSSK